MTDHRQIICFRLFSAAVFAAAILSASPAFAAGQPSPRAALHDDFGRIVFDWPGPVEWSDDVSDDQIVLHFDHPVAGDPSVLIKPLARFLSNVTVSTDKKDVTLKLAMPVSVKGFMTGQSTVFDLSPKTAEAAKGGSVAAITAAVSKGPNVEVRGGKHDDFTRIVFQWPTAVGVQVSQDGGRMEVTFDRPGRIKDGDLSRLLPNPVKLEGIKETPKGIAVSLSIPPGMGEHHYSDKGKVVLDLKPDVQKPSEPKQDAKQETKPEVKLAVPPAPEPAVEKEKPQQSAKTEPLPMPEPPKEPVAPAPAAQPEAAPASQPPSEVSAGAPTGASLTVGFDQNSAAAVFNRAGWWWLAFERKADVDAQAIAQVGGKAVLQADLIPTKKGSVFRLLLAEGFQPVPRKNGKSWVFDLAKRENTGPMTSYVPERQFDFQDRGRVLLRVIDPSKDELIFKDPEVGDTIHVVPVGTPGAGVREEVDLAEADLLPTLQGVAMVPKAERAWLDSTHGNVQLAMPGGLTMAHPVQAPSAEGHLTAKGGGAEAGAPPAVALEPVGVGDPIDPAKWARGGLAKFDGEHSGLLTRAIQEPPADRGPANLEVARHYLANGLDAEALGTLRGVAAQDPGMVDKPNFRAVRGIAALLMNRYPEAIEDLSHPSLKDDKRAPMWLAAARVAGGADPASQAQNLKTAADELKGMSAPLRMALGRPAALALLASGDTKTAGKVINGMDGPGVTQANRDTMAYLGGLAAEANKQPDEAVKRYLIAESGKSMQERALAAHNRIQIQFNQGKLSPEDAIHQLKRLPFVWRGGDFEYQTVKQAAQMLIDAGHYREGFQNLREILAKYSDHPDAPNVSKSMGDLFNRLFLEGEADKMPPIQAIGLYNEFQELTPPGDKGDEMIRKLADRLASVDLLDEASELLRHQVQYRLTGLEKARVATRLALLDLSNNNPKEALASLESSEMPGFTPEFATQRRFMRVQALADLDRTAEALALIVNDQGDAAKKMRADIYWKQKKWPEAAAALEAITDLPAPNKRLPPEQARHVIDLATALTLAKDERGLARLRKVYVDSMKASPLADAFDLLTSPPEHGIMDYHKVPDMIKQVQDFQTFMGDWQKKAKEQGLSSLN